MTRTTLLSVKVPAALGARLAAAAARKRSSKSGIVRSALEAALAAKRTPRARSFAAIAGDLAGCVSGPADLSHHPRHFRGYGR
ncbi:MAG: hypothetical protein ACREIY_01995 [Candidatus Rokuibacteriota bacterium]